ncbi:hypothetical protein AVEN_117513-2-1, partial [Araneus ventricosus]
MSPSVWLSGNEQEVYSNVNSMHIGKVYWLASAFVTGGKSIKNVALIEELLTKKRLERNSREHALNTEHSIRCVFQQAFAPMRKKY